MEATSLLRPGFADPVMHAQETFRMVLDAMSRPGSLHASTVSLEPPRSLHPATAALCLTLLDHETPLWLDPSLESDEVWTFLRFHCGCPRAEERSAAAFAVLDGAPCGLASFAQGTPEYPDTSATLICQVEGLREDGPLILRGPGIRDRASLGLSPFPAPFLEEWEGNQARFPRGVDTIWVSGKTIVGLPRTTRLEM
jgi:alpha-D-ribose 1-methylphosphonate 5-triphosphate synthase subunit PhnH